MTESSNRPYCQSIFWAASVCMLLTICGLEWMHTTFGKVVLSSDIKIALLLFTHMCFFSAFQLFSGALVDHYGSRILMPIAALFVLLGMLLQICTNEQNFPFMVVISQVVLTFGSSFSFIGIGYLSYGFFKKSIAGIMFGLAQMVYSIFNALSWHVSSYYEPLFKKNFKSIVWSIIILQFMIFIIMLYTASTPGVYRTGHVRFRETVLGIHDIVYKSKVLIVSLIGGLEFGLFFAVAGVMLYKADAAAVGSMASVCAWLGFAMGAPCACYAYSFLKKGRQCVFLVSGFIQSCSLFLLALFVQHAVEVHDAGWMACSKYIAACLFGFSSGGHMAAFSVGDELVSEAQVTSYCAVVNGFMCVFAGTAVLVLTMLMRYHALTYLLCLTSVFAILCYGVLYMILRAKTTSG